MDLLATHRLRLALGSPGCPICRIGDGDARHYLATTLHEYVNDSATRMRLADSWGFCRRHSWGFLALEWGRFHDGMSTANLAEWQLGRVLDLLRAEPLPPSRHPPFARRRRDGVSATLRARLEPTADCPACDSQHRGERYAIDVLLDHLDEGGELAELYRASSGLCLGHLRATLEVPDREATLRALIELERRRLEGLRGELEEYLRKHDYRFAAEPYGSELDAFVRATEFLAGSWMDLAGHSAIEGWEARRAELASGGRALVCRLCHTARSRREMKLGPADLDLAVCAPCVDRWSAAGRTCEKCGEPVTPEEAVAYLPEAGELGHHGCGGLRLQP